ncbi:MAG: sigma-E processing peptidase SpoIIGA [Clostridia bacterium]|nr:sigma-E processing peptidase SpoIIGA [Clostridia bacterium]
MRVVYVDTLFFLNLSVDYLLLLLTARLTGEYRSRGWLALGAAVGAVLAVMLYFLPTSFGLGVLLRGGTCAVTVLTAFGLRPVKRLAHLCGTFLLLTLVLAGAVFAVTAGNTGGFLRNGVLYADISCTVMLVGFTVTYLLSGMILGKGRAQPGRVWRDVRLDNDVREVRFRALCDSGNLLRDPISGRRVMLVHSGVVADLFEGPGKALLQSLADRQPEELLQQLRRCCKTAFWLLPVHTVSGERMILVFRPERIWIDGKPVGEYLVGLSPTTLDIGEDCQGLIGV